MPFLWIRSCLDWTRALDFEPAPYLIRGMRALPDEVTEDAVEIIADRAQPEDSPAVRQSTPACPLARSTASRSQRVFQVSANASSIRVRSS